MARGNPDNLRAAARRKHQAAVARATTALDLLERDGKPVTFRGLAKAAGVSVDFLYRSPLRAQIEQLQAAVAAAHGENLELRRLLGGHDRRPVA